MKRKYSWSKWLGAFLFAVAVITVYKTYDNLHDIFGSIRYVIGLLSSFFIGIGLAFFLYPGCRKLEEVLGRSKRKRIVCAKKGLSVLTVYAAFLLVLVAAIGMLMPRLSASVAELVKRLPGYMEEVSRFLRSLAEPGGPLEQFDVEQLVQALSFEHLYGLLFRSDWGQYVEGVWGFTSTLMSWFMGIIICVYALLERDSLFQMSRRLFGLFLKRETLDKIGLYIHEISSIFYRFFFGKAIDSLIIGVVATIGFTVLGVPYPLLMGVCIALFNMIPYFGPIIGAIPVILVSLLMKDIYAAIWTGLFILILQQVDANILGPKILSNSVGVSPFWVIFAIVVFGGLFGVWGMIIGVPTIAVIRMLLLDFLDDGKMNVTVREGAKPADASPGLFSRKKADAGGAQDTDGAQETDGQKKDDAE